jgi:hypothetical protein
MEISRKLLTMFFLTFIVVLTLPALAQSDNATRDAVASVRHVDAVITDSEWTPILGTQIKRPGKKDLFLLVTAECGMFTSAGEAFADAAVYIRVYVGGSEAMPGEVALCGKSNGLQAPFGKLTTCGSHAASSCGLSDDERNELERSLRSHGFNFLLLDLPNGIQNIVVKARVIHGSTGPAVGFIGKGSLEVAAENLKNKSTGP